MTPPTFRLPAEWEPQSAVLLAWPHSQTDWQSRLAEVEQTYLSLIAAITQFQTVALCCRDDAMCRALAKRFDMAGIPLRRVLFWSVPYNDTWLRDSGPIVLSHPDGHHRILDVRFTGWGGKFAAEEDDLLVRRLHAQGCFGHSDLQISAFALEGGAVETDGAGTLLTTWQCFHQRHPTLARAVIESQLLELLGLQRIIWLTAGALEGDDTDAHIDTLARFSSPNSLVYQSCDDINDSHHAALHAMEAQLRALRTSDGALYHLFPLPWPKPIYASGRRLAASYANFLIINDAVLMPAYDDPADQAATAVLSRAFPQRQIIPIAAKPLIWQNGSVHCITMQLPTGLFSHAP